MNEHETLHITPDTKVSDLLSVYPELEPVLENQAPAFAKITTPSLRKTLGQSLTLYQLAERSDVDVAPLINALRSEVGQSELSADSGSRPEWLQPEKIAERLDARPILQQGGHPVQTVMPSLQQLNSGDIYELIAPFAPVPLMEMGKSQGLDVWSEERSPDEIHTYFHRP